MSNILFSEMTRLRSAQVGAQLLIYNAQEHNKGTYSCLATNKYGKGTAEAKVNIVNSKYFRNSEQFSDHGGARGKVIFR